MNSGRLDGDTYFGKTYDEIRSELDRVSVRLEKIVGQQKRLKGEYRELKRLFPEKQRFSRLLAYLEEKDPKTDDPKAIGELFAAIETLRSVRKRSKKFHKKCLRLSKYAEKLEKRHDIERKSRWMKEYDMRHISVS